MNFSFEYDLSDKTDNLRDFFREDIYLSDEQLEDFIIFSTDFYSLVLLWDGVLSKENNENEIYILTKLTTRVMHYTIVGDTNNLKELCAEYIELYHKVIGRN